MRERSHLSHSPEIILGMQASLKSCLVRSADWAGEDDQDEEEDLGDIQET